MARESIFTLEATPIKFGPGAVEDAGWELCRLGVSRALLVTDPGVAAAGHAETVARFALPRPGSTWCVRRRRGSSRRWTRCKRPRTSRWRPRSTGSCRSAAARRSTPRRSRT